jgi:NAD dependent epimerase/dehydratase family enzyme
MPDQIKSILITGGTGLIGRLLVPTLLADGIETWILTRNPGTAKVSPGAKLVQWDGQTPTGWQHLVERVDAILNLAGENIGASPWTKARLRRIIDSRVFSGQALTTALRAASSRPKALLQMSGVDYYGPTPDGRQVDIPLRGLARDASCRTPG